MENTQDFARRNGFVETIYGRRCYIPNINDKNPMILNGSSKPKSTRVLGLLGNAYSGEAKQKYVDNYDRIFNKTNSKVNSKQLVK